MSLVNDVVGDDQVVEHRVQHDLHIAGPRQEPGAFESLQHVGLGLFLPAPLALDGRELVRLAGVALDGGIEDLNRRELVAQIRDFGFVAPKADLTLEVRLLAVDVGGHPHARADVHAPAVHAER